MEERREKPKNYMDLMKKVGDNGPYQRNVFIFLLINCIYVALIVFNTSFLFLRRNFKCQELGFSSQEHCQQQICRLEEQGNLSQSYGQIQIYSLTVEFGYNCIKKSALLYTFRTSVFIGVFISVFFVSIADSLGRKKLLVVAGVTQLLGTLILELSFNMWIANIGLLLMGLGISTALRITYVFISQIFQDKIRQKYSVVLQAGFPTGAILVGVTFWIVPHWRKNILYFYIGPALLMILGYIFYVQQTPKFLVQDIQKAVKAFNRIGRINKNQDNIVSQEDIKSVILAMAEQHHAFKNIQVNSFDLFRYKSLRTISIGFSILYFCKKYITFGPLILIDQLGMGIFLNQIVFGLSQCIALPLVLAVIQTLPRRSTGFVCIGSAALFFLITAFIKRDQNCPYCLTNIIQIGVLFILRIITNFYYPPFNLYTAESYPLRIRGIAFGFLGAIGGLGQITSQPLLLSLRHTKINPVLALVVVSIIGFFSICLIPQTLKKPLKDEIDEIQYQKDIYINQRDSLKNNENNLNQQDNENKLQILYDI